MGRISGENVRYPNLTANSGFAGLIGGAIIGAAVKGFDPGYMFMCATTGFVGCTPIGEIAFRISNNRQ